ncbi:MAG: GNAT family N-acetyltransferase [Thiohalomonadales bacterium]
MEDSINHLGQIVGATVVDWVAPNFPTLDILPGHYCSVVPLDIENHAKALFESYQADKQGRMWTYLPYGPFNSAEEYARLLEKLITQPDQQFYSVVDMKTKNVLGIAAYLRINPDAGSIEVGHLSYSPSLQKTTIATEAMYLMMNKIFEMGYRRYEWKCNSLNEASKSAALRLGFQFEGVFRQSMVIDGRNRDTAWYSIIDSEWTMLKPMFNSWLSESNFDASGTQLKSLSEFVKF